MAISSQEWDAISVVTTVTSSLSILCAIVTIAIYALRPHLRYGFTDLIILIAVAELISIPAYAVGRHGEYAGQESALCQWQAAAEQIGDLTSIFATACMSVDVLLIIFWGYSVEQVGRMHFRVHIPFCIITSSLIALAPLGVVDPLTGTRFYAGTGLWCWISSPFSAYRLYLFYIPLWTVFFFNICAYFMVGRRVWKRSRVIKKAMNGTRVPYKNTYIRNVSLYLVAFALSWTPATINRIYQFANPGEELFSLALLHSIFAPGNGVLNCLVYVYVAISTGQRSVAHSRMGRTDHDSTSLSRPVALFGGVGSAVQAHMAIRDANMDGKGRSPDSDEEDVGTDMRSWHGTADALPSRPARPWLRPADRQNSNSAVPLTTIN
ncbi:hypothetical protein THASP1DRAFT_28926 [Thamnocephalis sphaerospora]|uniref:G-protein coupled receptors family 1 profile domain-containing protein n=1 Tax=Thamnocephalis sphaerospora TaxID=78915 RepID=A0A4P9XT11_9FUNG|nr:hypothetical protein THASP1DRAFT_28926 [Thamnocephalis sphaerospora]|eukprot:RKP09277.1 hypothetical protein THASP1DRAFT_28926 [Thamnocephalis sphaerospora]